MQSSDLQIAVEKRMTPSLDDDLNLKNKIQQKEVEIQTELLRSRKECVKFIKNAILEVNVLLKYLASIFPAYLIA